MKISLTGATGFLGRYVAKRLTDRGDVVRAWIRPGSDASGLPESLEKVEGSLDRSESNGPLLEGCEAIVHAGLARRSGGFSAGEGADLARFLETNFNGTIRLIQDARAAGVRRFVFISTCAVHDDILTDRPLDESHPLWPRSHYGAHKAAIEAFVSSFGRGAGYPICALRPTGIYGLAHDPAASKWADLIARTAKGGEVVCSGGGKEVHVDDVARAVAILLDAPVEAVRGKAFSCCDRPIAQKEVAEIARRLSGSDATIVEARPYAPKNLIRTDAIEALGMKFGGLPLLERTVGEILGGINA